MSDEIKVSRPTPQISRSEQPSANYPESRELPVKSSKLPWLILGIVVVALVVLGVLFRDNLFKGKGEGASTVNSSKYQAVFLTNGQVYFGELSNAGSDYVTLKDIYYLQVGPQQGSGTPTDPAAQQQQQISLVKLGNELHGPVDEMHISRSQILFYEDLKEEGQVVKAIVQDKNTKK